MQDSEFIPLDTSHPAFFSPKGEKKIETNEKGQKLTVQDGTLAQFEKSQQPKADTKKTGHVFGVQRPVGSQITKQDEVVGGNDEELHRVISDAVVGGGGGQTNTGTNAGAPIPIDKILGTKTQGPSTLVIVLCLAALGAAIWFRFRQPQGGIA